MDPNILNAIITLSGVLFGAVLTLFITKLTAAGGFKIFLKRFKVACLIEKRTEYGESVFLNVRDIKDEKIKYFDVRLEFLVTNTSADFKSLNYLKIGLGELKLQTLQDDNRTKQEIYGLVTYDAEIFCFQGKSTDKLKLRAFIYSDDVKIFDNKYFYLIYSDAKNKTKKLKLSFDKFDIDNED